MSDFARITGNNGGMVFRTKDLVYAYAPTNGLDIQLHLVHGLASLTYSDECARVAALDALYAAVTAERDTFAALSAAIGQMIGNTPAAPRGDPAAPRGDPAAPRGDPAAPRGDPAAPRGDPAAPRDDDEQRRNDEARRQYEIERYGRAGFDIRLPHRPAPDRARRDVPESAQLGADSDDDMPALVSSTNAGAVQRD